MHYETINPANGQPVERFRHHSDLELLGIVDAAQNAYVNDWRLRPVGQRAEIMSRAAALLREEADAHARILTLEMGKRTGEARAEVALSASILDYYATHAEAYLRPRPVPEAGHAEVRVDPLGILLAIEPWNFPYYQVARVVGPQLMVGNVVLLKHAESVPRAARAFESLFERAGAPRGVFTNLFATIEQVGALIDDVRVRGVMLTGSERAGASVAERAGRNLKKVVLELGGSDPMIVLEDAPLDGAIEGAVAGRMLNVGQCCVGTKRVIVVGAERGRQFLEGMRQRMAAYEAGDPADPATTLGPLSSQRALSNLLEQIARARAAGATVVCGGEQIDRPGFYLQPTLLTDVQPSNPAYSEEFFGPVASFYAVEDEAQAIRIANDTPYGLGGSVYSADIERARRVAAQIESGMVFINRPFGTTPQLPFGGVKNSGFGRELSEAGFEEFVNKKVVVRNPVGTPPFGLPKAA